MPIINIKISKGRSVEIKQKLIEKITDDISEILSVEKEWITIIIDEYDRENWASNGILHSEKFGKGYGKNNEVE